MLRDEVEVNSKFISFYVHFLLMQASKYGVSCVLSIIPRLHSCRPHKHHLKISRQTKTFTPQQMKLKPFKVFNNKSSTTACWSKVSNQPTFLSVFSSITSSTPPVPSQVTPSPMWPTWILFQNMLTAVRQYSRYWCHWKKSTSASKGSQSWTAQKGVYQLCHPQMLHGFFGVVSWSFQLLLLLVIWQGRVWCMSVCCMPVCNDYVITHYFSAHAQLYSVWPLSSCYGWFPMNMLSSNTSLNP